MKGGSLELRIQRSEKATGKQEGKSRSLVEIMEYQY